MVSTLKTKTNAGRCVCVTAGLLVRFLPLNYQTEYFVMYRIHVLRMQVKTVKIVSEDEGENAVNLTIDRHHSNYRPTLSPNTLPAETAFAKY